MFARLLVSALTRRRNRKLLAAAAIWLGVTLVVGMLALSVEVGDAMRREVLSFGANLRIEPVASAIAIRLGGHDLSDQERPAYLEQGELASLRTIFWRNNILSALPRLWAEGSVAGRSAPLLGVPFQAPPPHGRHDPLAVDARAAYPHWQVTGRWPGSPRECLIGAALAGRLGLRAGEAITVRVASSQENVRLVGLLATGGREDGALVMPLATVQRLAALAGRISEADVSALTTPENRLAERFHDDPGSLTPAEYERFYCTPFPGSVAADIQKGIPGSSVRVVRRVAESQGAVLGRLGSLMLTLAVVTLLACSLSVAGVLAAAVLERRGEIALMRALGAMRGSVVRLFLAETAALGLAAGLLAAGSGALLARLLVGAIFGARPEVPAAVLLLAPLLGVGTSWLGSAWPVWRALGEAPAPVLHGG
jgi:putative ABC transport system permease protein